MKGEEERDDGESEAKTRVFQIKCNFSGIGGGMEGWLLREMCFKEEADRWEVATLMYIKDEDGEDWLTIQKTMLPFRLQHSVDILPFIQTKTETE